MSGAKDRGKKPANPNYEELLDYLQLGWTPMRLPPRSKAPYIESSHDAATINRDNIKAVKANENIGVRFTTAGALKDIDLDYPSAVHLAKAVGLTEGTAAFGRPSVGIGHLLFSSPGAEAKKFVLPEGEYPKALPMHEGEPSLTVMEIRGSDNTYTMVPPSVHPCGETLTWLNNTREPTKVEPAELRKIAGRHAFASAVLYFYPTNAATRYEVRLALAGALIRSEMELALAERYARAVARLGGDEKWEEDFLDNAEKRRDADKPYPGLPKLVEALQLPKACEATFREWLQQSKAEIKSSDIICAADIEMRAKHWLWEGHLLRGAVELLSGTPGLGKSQVQIHYVACATTGLPWPNGAEAIDPVNVIMVTTEDALDQEVVPRLIAAGADRKRVFILRYIRTDPKTKRQFLLAEDLEQLERDMARIGDVGLITIDPITAYMGGKMDSHKATEVRSQLGPLKDFAERNDVAISAITHPAKGAGPRAIDHFIGSQAFVAAARIGHVCVEEMEQEEDDEGKSKMVPTGRILFANPKNNADKRKLTLAYTIGSVSVGQDPNTKETILAPRVIWDKDAVDITADEAVALVRGATKDQTKSNQQKAVQAFLKEVLCGKGPRLSKEVTEQALAQGFTENQLRTARERLRVRSRKAPGEGGGWLWELPSF